MEKFTAQINCFLSNSWSKLLFEKRATPKRPAVVLHHVNSEREREAGIKIKRSIHSPSAPNTFRRREHSHTRKHTRQYIFHRIQSAANIHYISSLLNRKISPPRRKQSDANTNAN
jgi:hypothetical protein